MCGLIIRQPDNSSHCSMGFILVQRTQVLLSQELVLVPVHPDPNVSAKFVPTSCSPANYYNLDYPLPLLFPESDPILWVLSSSEVFCKFPFSFCQCPGPPVILLIRCMIFPPPL